MKDGPERPRDPPRKLSDEFHGLFILAGVVTILATIFVFIILFIFSERELFEEVGIGEWIIIVPFSVMVLSFVISKILKHFEK